MTSKGEEQQVTDISQKEKIEAWKGFKNAF
jgi:hypothetical protein